MNYKKLLLVGTLLSCSTLLFAAEGGQGQPVAADASPAGADQVETMVKVKTSDDKIFNVPLSRAKKMLIIKNMLEDLGQDDDASVPLPNVDGPTFELLISWIEFVGFATVHSDEDRIRAHEALKTKLLVQCGAENIQGQLDLLVSLGYAADFLNLHIFEGEDTYSAETMNMIAQLLVNLLIENKEAFLSGALHIPEQLNAFCAGNIFAECVMNLLQVWKCQKVLNLDHVAVYSVAVLSGDSIVVASGDRKFRVFELGPDDQWKLRKIFGVDDGTLTSFAVLEDGRVASGSLFGTVRVWNPSTGECLKILRGHTNSVSSLASLSGNLLASGSWDDTVRVWDASTGECLHVLEGHTRPVSRLAVLSGNRIVSGSSDGTVRVWDASIGRLLQVLDGQTNEVSSLAVLPGDRIVSGFSNGKVQIWQLGVDGQLISRKVLEGHRSSVCSLAVLSDNLFASCGNDGTVRVWDASTGQCLQVLRGHRDKVTSLAVLSDGSIFSGSYDYTVRVWSNPLIKHKDELTIGQAIVLTAILESKALPSVGSSAHAVWMSISEAIRDEVRRDFGIEAYDDAVPAAEPALAAAP